MLEQIITACVGLLILGGAYLVDVIIGVSKVIFTPELEFSWTKLWHGFIKALVISVGIVGFVVVLNLAQWFGGLVGADLSFLDGVSFGVIIAGILGGTGYYLANAAKNIVLFLNKNKVEVTVDETKSDYKQIADTTIDVIQQALDTLTPKKAKEQLEEDGVEVDHGEDIEQEPGKGSANTYPAPYATAAPDTLVDPSTCYNRECVSYCAWKINETGKGWPRRTGSMNAKEWIYRLPENGYKKVAAPKDGGKYVGILPSGVYGHALWFEGGNNVSEYNYSYAHSYGTRNINLAQYTWFEIIAPSGGTPSPAPSSKLSAEDLAKNIARGDYGNEPKRSQTLRGMGYSDAEIKAAQSIVNSKASVKPTTSKVSKFKVGDIVVPTRLVDYTGTPLAQYDPSYTITELIGDRAVLSARGAVWAAMNVKNIRKV